MPLHYYPLMDTSSNPKILMAERCAKELKNMLMNSKGVGKEPPKIAAEVEKKIVALKYSYLDLESMQPMLQELKSLMLNLLNSLGGNEWSRKAKSMGMEEARIAQIRFCMNIIYNLDTRLRLPDDPAYAVDIRLGEVESVWKHPNAEHLKVCNVNVGRLITVVTNDLSVKEGEKIPVALLPPVELRGIVSEGMFVGAGEGVSRKEGNVGELPRLSEEELNSVRKEVMRYLR